MNKAWLDVYYSWILCLLAWNWDMIKWFKWCVIYMFIVTVDQMTVICQVHTAPHVWNGYELSGNLVSSVRCSGFTGTVGSGQSSRSTNHCYNMQLYHTGCLLYTSITHKMTNPSIYYVIRLWWCLPSFFGLCEPTHSSESLFCWLGCTEMSRLWQTDPWL